MMSFNWPSDHLVCLHVVTAKIDETVLLAETHSPRPMQSPATFIPLGISEHLVKGDLVGIDAEFVTVNQVLWCQFFVWCMCAWRGLL